MRKVKEYRMAVMQHPRPDIHPPYFWCIIADYGDGWESISAGFGKTSDDAHNEGLKVLETYQDSLT